MYNQIRVLWSACQVHFLLKQTKEVKNNPLCLKNKKMIVFPTNEKMILVWVIVLQRSTNAAENHNIWIRNKILNVQMAKFLLPQQILEPNFEKFLVYILPWFYMIFNFCFQRNTSLTMSYLCPKDLEDSPSCIKCPSSFGWHLKLRPDVYQTEFLHALPHSSGKIGYVFFSLHLYVPAPYLYQLYPANIQLMFTPDTHELITFWDSSQPRNFMEFKRSTSIKPQNCYYYYYHFHH